MTTATTQAIYEAVLTALQPAEELAASLSIDEYRGLMNLIAAEAQVRALRVSDDERPAGDSLWRHNRMCELRNALDDDLAVLSRQLNVEPLVTVRLTADDLGLLIDGVDSHLYEEADERFRNSGNVIDPRLDRGVFEDPIPLDEDEEAVCELLDSHEPLIALLEAAQQRLAAS